ncbi:hypothetical protein [Enterococcus sp. DIV1314a]|uniref:hypothetical protein n=1 Tax=Enterococcus sp. DIV1314a TaxID=2774660 RepID=UPI003F296C87
MKGSEGMDKEYQRGFIVTGDKPYMTEEWRFQKNQSNNKKIVFYGYDANLCPMSAMSTWPETKWKKKVINIALKLTKDFKGEVWLDDVRIKNKKD